MLSKIIFWSSLHWACSPPQLYKSGIWLLIGPILQLPKQLSCHPQLNLLNYHNVVNMENLSLVTIFECQGQSCTVHSAPQKAPLCHDLIKVRAIIPVSLISSCKTQNPGFQEIFCLTSSSQKQTISSPTWNSTFFSKLSPQSMPVFTTELSSWWCFNDDRLPRYNEYEKNKIAI